MSSEGVLRLDTVKLRGIGPYFAEARLDIKPLTILCGENGSGKSTWLKILRILRDASHDDCFPILLPAKLMPLIGQEDCPTLVNSVYTFGAETFEKDGCYENSEFLDECSKLHNPDKDFGPSNTIRLEFTSLSKIYLGTEDTPITLENASPAIKLLAIPLIEAGSNLSLSITLKSQRSCMDVSKPDKIECLDLQLDGMRLYRIFPEYFELSKDASVLLSILKGKTNPIESPCKVLEMGLDIFGKLGESSPDYLTRTAKIDLQFLTFCTNLFKKLTQNVLDGIFILSGNRNELSDENLGDNKLWEELSKQTPPPRFVGYKGEEALILERIFSQTSMGQIGNFTKEDEEKLFDKRCAKIPEFKDKSRQECREMLNPLRDGEDISSHFKALCWALTTSDFSQYSAHYSDNVMIYPLKNFCNYWLDALLSMNSGMPDDFLVEPNGFLADFSKIEKIDPYTDSEPWESEGPRLLSIGDRGRHTQGALSDKASVSSLSSGFHYITPMIIQAALMRQGETFAVESPEAHMHPKLQIKIAEFFLAQMKSGRQIILETHSDLIVRRAIRALLEEEVKQDEVRIYFTRVIGLAEHPVLHSVSALDPTVKTSVLDPIKINELGQIENWPPGFLDADIIESRRLMDAMYGAMEKKNAE